MTQRLDLILFAIYLAANIALGMWVGRRRTGDTRGYFLAGDRLPWYAIGGSIIAANISTEHFIGMVGIDISGVFRFTFGVPDFYDGIGLVPVLMGLFGIAEVMFNLEQVFTRRVFETKIKGLLPNREDWKKSFIFLVRSVRQSS